MPVDFPALAKHLVLILVWHLLENIFNYSSQDGCKNFHCQFRLNAIVSVQMLPLVAMPVLSTNLDRESDT